jgi:tetraacyldisaccharide 4'-kinase
MTLFTNWENWINQLHYPLSESRYALLYALLSPLSQIYRLGLQRHQRQQIEASDQYSARVCPQPCIISVGNLTTGGTGKTPIVIALAEGIVAAGQTVSVLSRGYKATQKSTRKRTQKNTHQADGAIAITSPAQGDEAYLVQQRVPQAIVKIGKNRIQLLKETLANDAPQFIILDDAFQYRRITPSVNIVLIEGKRLAGNGFLLPVGPLREPLEALERADIIMITKTVSSQAIACVNQWVKQYVKKDIPVLHVPFQPDALIHWQSFLAGDESRISLDSHPEELSQKLDAQRVILISGIANPDSFQQHISEIGLCSNQHLVFPDHHVYTQQEIQHHFAGLACSHSVLITTEKDVSKLYPLLPEAWQPKLHVLRILPKLDGQWFYDEFLTVCPGQESPSPR